jgi:hypothetical protein
MIETKPMVSPKVEINGKRGFENNFLRILFR